jgi:membrane protease YdiL (CAAX protease family)
VFLTFVHFVTFMAVITLGAAFSSGEYVSALFVVASGLVGPLAALYVGLTRYAPTERTSSALSLDTPQDRQWGVLLFSVLAGAVLAPLAVDAGARIDLLFPPEPTPDLEVTDPTAGMTAFVTVAQVFAGPFVHEVFFRGFMQRRLALSIGQARSFGLVLLLYTMVHISPRLMPTAVIIGLPMGIIALRAQSSWTLIAGHMAHMAAWTAILNGWLPMLDAGRLLPWWGHVTCASAAAVFTATAWRLGKTKIEAAD